MVTLTARLSYVLSGLSLASHQEVSGALHRTSQIDGQDASANSHEENLFPGGFAAKAGCPCIDSSFILRRGTTPCDWKEEKVVINVNGTEQIVEKTYAGVLENGRCFPLTYGASKCNTYDATVHLLCTRTGVEPPAFCSRSWCYVDTTACRKSEQIFFRSTFAGINPLFQDLFYSYSTCNASADAWLEQETVDAFDNRTLVVAIPLSSYPRHFKTYKDGQVADDDFSDIAFNDDYPWTGFMVDYLNAILKISNIPAVKYVYRSRGSTQKGYESKWTQTVTDVEAGVADLAMASFWVTAERLRMTPFTVPIITDTFKLYIEQPKLQNQGLQDNAARLLSPFSRELWILIFLAIVSFGSLSSILSPHFFREDVEERQKRTFRGNRRWLAGLYADGITLGFMSFLQGSIDIDMSLNASSKILNLGFAFVLFVAICTYTANLAALLVITNSGGYVSNIETAIARKMAICAMTPLQKDLMALHPNAHWVWSGTEEQMIQSYDDGKCSALVQGWVDIRGDTRKTSLFCARDLVRVGPSILEKPVAFPASSNIVAGLSHWITEGRNRGIEFEDFLMSQESPCTMELILSGKERGGLPVVTATNLMFPLSFFCFCCVVAVATHIHSKRKSQTSNSKSDDDFPEQAASAPAQEKVAGLDEESPISHSQVERSGLSLQSRGDQKQPHESIEGVQETLESLLVQVRRLSTAKQHAE